MEKIEIGRQYNDLIPLKRVGINSNHSILYDCLCICGNHKNVSSRNLIIGKVKSCGCRRSKCKNLSTSITYKSWISAKQRCENVNDDKYVNYGARGIKMCERWRNSFMNFLEDMGERPNVLYTLDRIDVNGNYEPQNCRWVDMKTQGNNRRNNRFIEFNGEKLTATLFAEKYNIGIPYLFYALRIGKTPKEIINSYSKIREAKKNKAIKKF